MEYWQSGKFALEGGCDFELKARIALVLIEKWGTVAAVIDGEDSAGRAKLQLQSAQYLIDRCFSIAELFVARAEADGLIRAVEDRDAAAREIGRLEGVTRKASYDESIPGRRETAEERAARVEAEKRTEAKIDAAAAKLKG